MNMHRYVAAVACAGFGANALAGGLNLYSQNFDNILDGYSTTTDFFDSNQHFTTGTQGDFNATGHNAYVGGDGQFFSALNAWSGSFYGLSVLTLDTIDISGKTNLQFAMDIAADHAFIGWEGFVEAEYQVDGGGWATLFDVTGLVVFGPPLFSSSFSPDDGLILTNAFSTITADLSSLSGNDLDIRFTFEIEFFEYIGLDNILVTGDNNVAVVPLPPAAFAGLGLLAGMGAYRRIRR